MPGASVEIRLTSQPRSNFIDMSSWEEPKPGWYADPDRPWIERWWDGRKFVGQTRQVKKGKVGAPFPGDRLRLLGLAMHSEQEWEIAEATSGAPSVPSSSPHEGWYFDGSRPDHQRWWTGTSWIDVWRSAPGATDPMQLQPVDPPPSIERGLQRKPTAVRPSWWSGRAWAGNAGDFLSSFLDSVVAVEFSGASVVGRWLLTQVMDDAILLSAPWVDPSKALLVMKSQVVAVRPEVAQETIEDVLLVSTCTLLVQWSAPASTVSSGRSTWVGMSVPFGWE